MIYLTDLVEKSNEIMAYGMVLIIYASIFLWASYLAGMITTILLGLAGVVKLDTLLNLRSSLTMTITGAVIVIPITVFIHYSDRIGFYNPEKIDTNHSR